MTTNKEIKNQIDEIKVDDYFIYNWVTYMVTSIEDEVYELASTTTKCRYEYLTYDDLFDYLFENAN